MQSLGIPNSPLVSEHALPQAFKERGVDYFRDAMHYVHQLPYARPPHGDYHRVLEAGCGTCSSKHALVAALAQVMDIPLKLWVGIFMLNAQLVPAAGPILAELGLQEIPEAHCYLVYQGTPVDLTFAHNASLKLIYTLLTTRCITPDGVGTHKVQWHQAYIKQWMQQQGLRHDFGAIWRAREACISALSG